MEVWKTAVRRILYRLLLDPVLLCTLPWRCYNWAWIIESWSYCFVHRVSFIHTAVINRDSKSIQASVPVGPDAKMVHYSRIRSRLWNHSLFFCFVLFCFLYSALKEKENLKKKKKKTSVRFHTCHSCHPTQLSKLSPKYPFFFQRPKFLEIFN